MGPFSRWFEERFEEVLSRFEEKRFDMGGEGSAGHDEAYNLRKSKTRYRDTLSLIEKELRSPEGLRFADVGGGHVAWFVAQRFPGRTVALDLGATFAEEAKSLGVETLAWDVTRGDPPVEPASFDIVSFTEVLEHLPPPPFPHVRRVASLLKPGGILLFTVPNMAAFMKRVKFALLGRSPIKLGEVYQEKDGCPHHIREYTVPEVRRFLPACGLEIERLRTGDYGWGRWRRVTSALHRVTTRWGRTIMVRARKTGGA